VSGSTAPGPGEFTVRTLGRVVGGRDEWVEDGWGSVTAAIEVAPDLPDDVTLGLSDFSHLEVVFVFDRVTPEASQRAGARHPRGNEAWPEVGLFASRGPVRPNRLGVSRCRLLEAQPRRLVVQGLDALDGTPVLDVKPWFEPFAPRDAVRQPAWVGELTSRYY